MGFLEYGARRRRGAPGPTGHRERGFARDAQVASWQDGPFGQLIKRTELEQFRRSVLVADGGTVLHLPSPWPMLGLLRLWRRCAEYGLAAGDVGAPGGVVIRGDLHHLPFRDDSLCAVIAPHSLELLDDPRVALKEIERVMMPGGQLLLSGLDPWSLTGLRVAAERLGRREREPFLHSHSAARMQRLVAAGGLTVESVSALTIRPMGQGRWARAQRQLIERFGVSLTPGRSSVWFLAARKRQASGTLASGTEPARPDLRRTAPALGGVTRRAA